MSRKCTYFSLEKIVSLRLCCSHFTEVQLFISSLCSSHFTEVQLDILLAYILHTLQNCNQIFFQLLFLTLYSSATRYFSSICSHFAEVQLASLCKLCIAYHLCALWPYFAGIIRNTRMIVECLHRFCKECIEKSLRLGYGPWNYSSKILSLIFKKIDLTGFSKYKETLPFYNNLSDTLFFVQKQ